MDWSPGDWTPQQVGGPETEDFAAAQVDHERNPEYEQHVGRVLVMADGRRVRAVSVWLGGVRWSGLLYEQE